MFISQHYKFISLNMATLCIVAASLYLIDMKFTKQRVLKSFDPKGRMQYFPRVGGAGICWIYFATYVPHGIKFVMKDYESAIE